MLNQIPQRVKEIWDEWNIRGVVLISLSLQAFLILFSPLRKRTANKLIIMLIWSVYLLADSAATFAVGLISDSQSDALEHSEKFDDLLAFWPPFLLLHLGGPDAITAFSLEDNELWLRHALGFVIQIVATAYVFLLSFPRSKLSLPTIAMSLAGIIKYLERTRALYLASLDKFRDFKLRKPDPGPNYVKLMDDISSKKEANIPTTIIVKEEHSGKKAKRSPVDRDKPSPVESDPASPVERDKPSSVERGQPSSVERDKPSSAERDQPSPVERDKPSPVERDQPSTLDDLQVVHYAYHYFKIFSGLIVDLIFSFKERNESRDFFNKLKPEDALRVIEVELNFIYEALYTKARVVHSRFGYLTRFISFASVVVSLSLFYFQVNKSGFYKTDVKITYILFLGAIILDILAFTRLIFSDWIFACLFCDPKSGSNVLREFKSRIAATTRWFLIFKRPRCYAKKSITNLLFGRWSGNVSGYNLISYCLKDRPADFHRVKNSLYPVIMKCIPGKDNHFTQFVVEGVSQFLGFIYCKVTLLISELIHSLGLKGFVDEMRYVSTEPLTKKVWEFIYKELQEKSSAEDPEDTKKISSARGEWILKDKSYLKYLLPYLTGVTYDESLLLWHIATELLYQTEEEKEVTGNNHNDRRGGVTSNDNNSHDKEATGNNDHPNYRKFSKLLSDYMLYLLIMHPDIMSVEAGIGEIRFQDTCAEARRLFTSKNLGHNEEKKACQEILDVNIYVKPVLVKGDRSKSVLFDASKLAQLLDGIQNEDKWETVSKVWVELLSYAACNSVARVHAQQVNKGGEFITFIWLLMAHLGVGRQFQINRGQGATKLIVSK